MPALAFVIGLLFLIPSAPALCQEDIEGGTDIPYFTRMPNFYIESNDNRHFDRYMFYDGKKLVAVEGVVHQTTYRLKEGLTNPPSDLPMRRNYINAIKSKWHQARIHNRVRRELKPAARMASVISPAGKSSDRVA